MWDDFEGPEQFDDDLEEHEREQVFQDGVAEREGEEEDEEEED